MKKTVSTILFVGTILSSFFISAQTPDWEKLVSSKEIQKVYTYKNYTTYALLKTGGMLVFNHANKKISSFDRYNSPLKSNILNDIVVTDDSTIYIASRGAGLIKIKNGQYEEIYGDNSWTSASIKSVSIAPNGDIWFSNDSFTVFQITTTGIIIHESGTGSTIGNFDDVEFTASGEIWAVGTWGISNFNGSVWTTYQPFFPTSYYNLELDATGTPWVTSGNGLLTFKNNSWSTIYNPNGYTWPKDLIINASGKIIMYDFGSWSSYNPTNGSWSSYSFGPHTSPYKSFILNNNDDLFVSTSNGYVLETTSKDFSFVYKNGVSFKGEPTVFLEDSHGNFWIATNSSGLYRITKTDTIYYNYNGGFTDSQVYSLTEDKEGKVWIGGPNRLHYFENDSIYEVQHSSLNYYAIYDMLVDDDNSIWAASIQGLFHISKNDTVLYNVDNSPIPSNQLKRIEKDKDGNLWIASDLGMIRFNRQKEWFLFSPTNSTLPGTYINDTETDAFGNIWIGMMNYGNPSLCVWDGSTFIPFDIDPTQNDQAHVVDLAIDKYGNKWLATQSHGFVRFDGNTTTYFTSKNSGSPENNLYATYIMKSGKILVGASDIIVAYNDPATYLDSSNVKGVVYNDENGNGILDNNENKLPFAQLKIWGSQKVLYTNGNGEFSVSLQPDDYLIGSKETTKWNVVGTVYPIKVTTTGILNISIPFKSVSTISEAEISLSGGFPRCNTNVVHIIDVRNDGTKIQDATVKLVTKAPKVSNFPNPSSIDGDTLKWEVKNMLPGQPLQLKSILTMPSFDGDFEAFASVSFYDLNSAFNAKKSDSLKPEVKCAFDPNDKIVNPVGVGKEKYQLISAPKEYLIRFQNTGNDTAFNVTVTDTLSSLLDYTSFKFLGSSHKVQVTQEDSILVFYFKNIQLPDSTQNKAESNGYVHFRIQPKPSVPEYSILQNTANIYFDFNPAIVTNSTRNTLISKLPQIPNGISTESLVSDNNVLLYPNPAKDHITIEIKDAISGFLSVYNMEGQLISSTPIVSDKTQIPTTDLKQGIYTVKIETGAKTEQIKFIK